jgi:hypothetical protein
MNPAHAATAFPPSLPRSPPFGPLPACSRARAVAPRFLSLSLASRPHLPAALSRALTPAGRPAPPVSRFVVLPTYGSSRSPPTVVPSIAPVPSPIPSPHRRVCTTPSLPLDRVLARYRPAVRSRRRRCAALMPALCTSPAPAELRRSPSLGRL